MNENNLAIVKIFKLQSVDPIGQRTVVSFYCKPRNELCLICTANILLLPSKLAVILKSVRSRKR